MYRMILLTGGAGLMLAGAVGAFFLMAGPGDAADAAPVATIPAPAEMAYGNAVDPPREPISLDRVEAIPMTVYLTPTCGCCSGWVEHMEGFGFEITLEYHGDLTPVKQGFAIPNALVSCHTGIVNGYVLEGHVPGDVVRQFLAEAPAVRGLAVPGMPIGSPGMEVGGQVDPYDVVTFTSTGQTEVYSRQGRP